MLPAETLGRVPETRRHEGRFLALEPANYRLAISQFHAQPMTMHLLRRVDATSTAEGIKYQIPGLGGYLQHPPEQLYRQLVGATTLRDSFKTAESG